MTLTATAMGLSSSLVATAKFTDAPKPQPHNVNFATSGLPDEVSITVNWSKTNPAGNPASGSTTFTSPGPSGDEGTRPGTAFTYSGFPTSVTVKSDTYDLVSTLPESGFTTGGAGESTTVTATYTKRPTVTCPTNSAPTINASDLDLGQVVGCLVNGSFQTTASISPDDFKPVTSDPEKDPVTVTLSTSSVTLVGPGLAEVDVTLTATDDPSKRNVDGCPVLTSQSATITVKVKAQIIYNFGGFGAPLSATTIRSVKQGSTVPVKFRLYDCSGIEICNSNLPNNPNVTSNLPVIDVLFVSGAAPYGDPDVTDSGSSNDNGSYFRYSGTCGVDGTWIYNLKTTTQYMIGCTYKISVTLNDGTTHDVCISMKNK